jgi:hypothetical protein
MFDGTGGLVQFALTEAEREANRRFEQPGFVGHPAGLEWFCPEHLAAAKALQHLSVREALRQLPATPSAQQELITGTDE